MENTGQCQFREGTLGGLQAVFLENECLRVSILTGKGADLYELIYKPAQMDYLLKTKRGLTGFTGLDLSKQRLRNYSEHYAGGWQDCLPHRGTYGGHEITQSTGGIAATVPWQYEAITVTADTVAVRCFVTLPVMPLYVERTYTLKKNEAVLYIHERIRNTGTEECTFTWTQHAAFGGDFLDGNVRLELLAGRAFHAKQYEPGEGSDLSPYEEPISGITFSSGVKRDLRRALPSAPPDAAEQVFVVLRDLTDARATLINEPKQAGITLKWELEAFPYIRCWMSSSQDLYVLGIEPSNDAFVSLEASLRHGTFRVLQPAEEYSTSLTCECFTPKLSHS